MISACKTGSARRVTAVIPLFPYSRQPDLPYNKAGAPLYKAPSDVPKKDYTFESVPATPLPGGTRSATLTSGMDITERLLKATLTNGNSGVSSPTKPRANGDSFFGSNATNGNKDNDTNGVNGGVNGVNGANGANSRRAHANSTSSTSGNYTTHNYENPSIISAFQGRPGYKQWVAQAGTLVANLLTCAGADHGMYNSARYIFPRVKVQIGVFSANSHGLHA